MWRRSKHYNWKRFSSRCKGSLGGCINRQNDFNFTSRRPSAKWLWPDITADCANWKSLCYLLSVQTKSVKVYDSCRPKCRLLLIRSRSIFSAQKAALFSSRLHKKNVWWCFNVIELPYKGVLESGVKVVGDEDCFRTCSVLIL